MPKLKNPPPKRVRLTKNLGYETRKFLNYLDFRMRTATSVFDFHDLRRQCSDDLCALRAHWNTWWDQEKAGRKVRRFSKEVKYET
jgi:hypothetical protein